MTINRMNEENAFLVRDLVDLRERQVNMLTRKVLFICTGNHDRSPTAEEMFRDVEGLEVDSAGTSPCGSPFSKPVSKELIERADMIFAMEDRHREAILEIDASAKDKIVVLNIPDIYLRNEPELKRLLLERVCPLLPECSHQNLEISQRGRKT